MSHVWVPAVAQQPTVKPEEKVLRKIIQAIATEHKRSKRNVCSGDTILLPPW